MGRPTVYAKVKRREEDTNGEYSEVKHQVGKTKKRVKTLATLIKAQTLLLRAVVEKIDPDAEYDKIISAASEEDWVRTGTADDGAEEEEEGLMQRVGRIGKFLSRKTSESSEK